MKNIRLLKKSSRGFWVFLIGFIILLLSSPPLLARNFQVLYDLQVDGNTNTPYGGIGRYQNLLVQSENF
ncbi:MAG: hypothetical protein AAB267_01745, partial [Candidatus Desantisbacteria bacterium]